MKKNQASYRRQAQQNQSSSSAQNTDGYGLGHNGSNPGISHNKASRITSNENDNENQVSAASNVDKLNGYIGNFKYAWKKRFYFVNFYKSILILAKIILYSC